ncbi:MAG: hypothetical protein LBM60_02745, partial [Clostridium sp.]|nr:hypothetical protein [Clostridium sp.]
RLVDTYNVHLDECRPGLGGLDYPAYLSHILALGGETPIMLEHMTKEEDYRAAVAYIENLVKIHEKS